MKMRVSRELLKVAADIYCFKMSDVDEGNASVEEWLDDDYDRKKQNFSFKNKKEQCL